MYLVGVGLPTPMLPDSVFSRSYPIIIENLDADGPEGLFLYLYFFKFVCKFFLFLALEKVYTQPHSRTHVNMT
jgi:hypothetical protein